MDFAELEEQARAFAIERHGAQKYGMQPYRHHLEQVRRVLASFDLHGALGVAAWLHDVVEDTKTSREEIAQRFGDEVAQLVWAVTGVGKSRPERNASMYLKVRAHPPAALLKLADRIANVEASREVPEKLAMYAAELPAFREHLQSLGDERMWERLERATRPT